MGNPPWTQIYALCLKIISNVLLHNNSKIPGLLEGGNQIDPKEMG